MKINVGIHYYKLLKINLILRSAYLLKELILNHKDKK